MDGSEQARARGSTEELGLEAKVQLVRVGLHLLLHFLLVVIDLPGDVDMHGTPLPWFPENRSKWIR
jgi:hypothetical protein